MPCNNYAILSHQVNSALGECAFGVECDLPNPNLPWCSWTRPSPVQLRSRLEVSWEVRLSPSLSTGSSWICASLLYLSHNTPGLEPSLSTFPCPETTTPFLCSPLPLHCLALHSPLPAAGGGETALVGQGTPFCQHCLLTSHC